MARNKPSVDNHILLHPAHGNCFLIRRKFAFTFSEEIQFEGDLRLVFDMHVMFWDL